MKIKCIIFLFTVLIFSCKTETNTKTETTNELLDTITTNVIAVDSGWGYQISINSKIYIEQTIIPAISGKYAFGSANNARITANFVVQKIMNNILPPTVSVEELDSLGVLTNKINLIKQNENGNK